MATADGGTMQSFQKHIEDMRSLTLCKICLKPFFEPYIISCGHTYCYSCLRSWFGNNTDRTKTKSCPDCRIVVKVQPAPNYILRDLTHMFIGRAELLPEDESVQEHDKDKKEAAAQLTKDREGAGLFQGVFSRILPAYLRGPIRDIEDGVDRCPMCNWELEDGVCAGCGLDMHDSDYESDDTEGSIGEIRMDRPPGTFYGVGSDSEDDSSEDESNLSGPNEYDHHDDFLDHENEDDADDLDDMEGMTEHTEFYPEDRHTIVPRRHRRVAFSDDESEEEEEDVPRPHRTQDRSRSAYSAVHLAEDSGTNYDESDNEMEPEIMNQETEEVESEDEQPVIRSRIASNTNAGPVSANRRRQRVIDDDDDEDEEDIQSEHAVFSSQAGTETSTNDEESDEDGTLSGESSDSDSQESSESESGSETGLGHQPEAVSDSEDTDDTAQPEPPQPRNIRQQRLQNQRARRPQQHQSRILPSMSNYPHNGPDDRLAQRGQTSKATRVY